MHSTSVSYYMMYYDEYYEITASMRWRSQHPEIGGEVMSYSS